MTVEATTTALPVMRNYSSYVSGNSWKEATPDYHNDSIRNTITEIEFIDLDDTTLSVPTINGTTSWDVSAKQNGSVIAWLNGTKLYIGGKGGVIGNSNCSSLFYEFINVISIEFNNNFDTSKVENMHYMFKYCKNLISIDIGTFDTKNVTTMAWMFEYNDKLKNLDVSKFKTDNIINIQGMFYGCRNLKEIDFTNWNITDSLKLADYLFAVCLNLKELNLSNFDTTNVTDMRAMFARCTNLKTVYVSNKFVTTNVIGSSSMFGGDINLVGGNGTVYDYNNIVKAYARIDGGVSSPGYFTDGSIPVIRSVNNTSTSNSIKVIADTYVPNGDNISKIEFSVDGGNTWHEQTDSSVAENIYTFTNLNANTNYNISIRVTSEN